MADKDLQTALANVFKKFKFSPDAMKSWFKEADIIGEGTGITEADVDAAFTKTCKDEEGLDFAGLKECLNTLAKKKKVEPMVLMEKLATFLHIYGKNATANIIFSAPEDDKEE